MNGRFSDLTDEAGRLAARSRDTFVPQPRAADPDRTPQSRADTDRTPQSRTDSVSFPDRPGRSWDAGREPALAARSPADIPQAADPVDVATGDVLLFQDDVSLPAVLPLVIGRAYRSSWRAGRWFGTSWASSLDQRLRIAPDRITGVFADEGAGKRAALHAQSQRSNAYGRSIYIETVIGIGAGLDVSGIVIAAAADVDVV